jgi:tryptophan synthase beta chain
LPLGSSSPGPKASSPRRKPTTPFEGAIDEALKCKEEGVSPDPFSFNLCGHGHFDMQAYMDYNAGKLVDQKFDEGELAMALAGLPSVKA